MLGIVERSAAYGHPLLLSHSLLRPLLFLRRCTAFMLLFACGTVRRAARAGAAQLLLAPALPPWAPPLLLPPSLAVVVADAADLRAVPPGGGHGPLGHVHRRGVGPVARGSRGDDDALLCAKHSRTARVLGLHGGWGRGHAVPCAKHGACHGLRAAGLGWRCGLLCRGPLVGRHWSEAPRGWVRAE